ncbi:monovalent cation:proton antiporter family protein [Megalodesulfovibrio gigas]|uniref:Putative sodium/hydrogen exchanger n=1 Tax=Megalodesulfovibrio gigas (strain ATCC 19364 / DSM 1382 / NCIMB 9332 / VKM B-1759) TaxID=1121448 RepID=T2GDV4_MEGG1|nr:monovalent cation:proton antiporter family protein [Megalodesulfovibrio gigas]AGW14057.1 putative sodium/hydrogen exchanger [Megalodesulfovibrio gigas DSM 1382 = ATCC 19364]
MPHIPLLPELIIVFGFCIIAIFLCFRVKLPAIVGVLITGVLVGPGGFGVVDDPHAVESIAELGVILLMFTIGLELSLGELKALKKPVLIGGGLQVLFTIALIFELGLTQGFDTGPAILAGFLVALSSTAIVIKLLQERSELAAPHGRIMLAVLIFQDIIVAPMMLLTPFLGSDSPDLGRSMMLLGAKAVGVIVVVWFLAKFVVPRLLLAVLRTRSRELFLLSVLVLCLAIAMFTAWVGLSISLGAFLAGLIIAQTDYALSALEGVHPFRDVFTSLFFVSIGMLLDVQFMVNNLPLVLGAAAAVLLCKAVVAGGATVVLGYPLRIAVLVGMGLSQVGEFSFVLAKVGSDAGLLTPENYQLFLAISILTMLAAPFCIAGSHRVSRWVSELPGLGAWRERSMVQEEPRSTLKDHLIIVGFGLGGRQLAQAAKSSNIAYCIVEMNPDTVRTERTKGEPISHGDAGLPEVLKHLGVEQAKVLAVVVADPLSARRVTQVAKSLNPAIRLVVRTRYVAEVDPLRHMGADDVVAEEFETSIEVFARVLRAYLVPHVTIERYAREVRQEGYELLRRGQPVHNPLHTLDNAFSGFEVSGLTVEEGAVLDGQTLEESGLRKRHGLTVVAVQRGEELFANPDGAFRLQAGDVAYLFGSQQDFASRVGLFEVRHKAWA